MLRIFTQALWMTILAAGSGWSQTPQVVAHRGLLFDAPENTIPAFRACLDLRLGFELDVQSSQDGTLVCVHDTTLDRTTNGKGPVAGKTLQQLKSLDAGSWFSPEFHGLHIPTLDEVFQLLGRHREANVLIAIDLKGSAPGIEAKIVELANKHRILGHLLMIGRTINDSKVRQRFHKASNRTQIACLANTPAELQLAISDKHSNWVYLRFIPTAEQVRRIKTTGKRIFIAGTTVSGHEKENWAKAQAAGVDGILTDYSIELKRTLKSPKRQD